MTRHAAAFLLPSLLLVTALVACTGPGSADALDGTSWVLTSIDGAAPIPGRSITLGFEEGEVRGSSGCNSYFGTYEARGDMLSVADLMWTEMACVEPGWMEQETAYLSRLAGVQAFALNDGQLQLLTDEGRTLIYELQP